MSDWVLENRINQLEKENERLKNQIRLLSQSAVVREATQGELENESKTLAKLSQLSHLAQLSHSFYRSKSKASLFTAACDFIVYHLQVERGLVFYRQAKGVFTVQAHEGYFSLHDLDLITDLAIAADDPLIELLNEHEDPIFCMGRCEHNSLMKYRFDFLMDEYGIIRFSSGMTHYDVAGFLVFGTSAKFKDKYAKLADTPEVSALLKLLRAHLGTVLENLDRLNDLIKTTQRFKELATRDPLTSLLNRRGMKIRLEAEFARAHHGAVDGDPSGGYPPMGVIIADIDFFKDVNDTYGHSCGDFILKQISKLLLSSIRKRDFLGRWGGEEFLMLLPDAQLESSRMLAEKLRQKIENHPFKYESHIINLTMSFGVSFAAGSSEESLYSSINKADSCLYKAKQTGRNKVVAEADTSN